MRLLLTALLAATVGTPAAAGFAGHDPLAVFDQADADHDGRVSRDEFRAARSARFAQMDRNGDGVVSRDDFTRFLKFRPQAGARIDAMLAEADANHDGKVSRAELDAAPATLFDRADTNHDGFVDKAELGAARAKIQQLRQGL
jgi:hypothetical protein